MTVVRSATLRGFREVVTGLNGDPVDLVLRFGLPPECLGQDDVLIDAPATTAMLEEAAAQLNAPDLGLRLASAQSLSVLGPLAVAVTNSPTIGDAVDCLTRYISVHSRMVSLATKTDPLGKPDTVALIYRPAGRSGPVQAGDLGVGSAHRVISYLNRGPYKLRSVELPYEPAAPPAAYREFFGAPVHSGRVRGGVMLRLASDVLATPLRGVDDTIHQLALAYLARRSATRGQDVVSRMRTAVQESLGTGSTNLNAVARLLLLHPRTLQRQLASAGASFEQIVDDERRDKSLRLLIGTELPVGQIAAMIGMNEQASFTRAARRWWNATPSQTRQHRH
ncbi:AraC family transcriptional regulator [Mycobacterium sp. D16R24]|uniref:AraC family transcriptional regulator n=1 Tax=Mycobacterium sp. D16R24 TaxID=1855656 RepID=UPI000991CB3F|nr:AraC family transcriptional regulator [Mycobacterium sp. D16R24]